MSKPNEILALEQAFSKAEDAVAKSLKSRTGGETLDDIKYVVRCKKNRAGVRLILSAVLGRLVDKKLDPLRPYTEIGGRGSFSGRVLDETFVWPFVAERKLPCNATTAYLTPTLRNQDQPLDRGTLVGAPKELYTAAVRILKAVSTNKVPAEDVLIDTFAELILFRDEQAALLKQLLAQQTSLREERANGLSAEAIVSLLGQHLAGGRSSRLPVLMVAATYVAVEDLDWKVKPLEAHNAADKATGVPGDIVVLLKVGGHVTVYEMKHKAVTIGDVDVALKKVLSGDVIHQYVFVTTSGIDAAVTDYAQRLYSQVGTEFSVVDCLGFLRHFLTYFHHRRSNYVEAYQTLVLNEPDSAVGPESKALLLALRNAAESAIGED